MLHMPSRTQNYLWSTWGERVDAAPTPYGGEGYPLPVGRGFVRASCLAPP